MGYFCPPGSGSETLCQTKCQFSDEISWPGGGGGDSAAHGVPGAECAAGPRNWNASKWQFLSRHFWRLFHRRSLQPSQENIQHFKKHDCPLGSGFGSTYLIESESNPYPDPDPKQMPFFFHEIYCCPGGGGGYSAAYGVPGGECAAGPRHADREEPAVHARHPIHCPLPRGPARLCLAHGAHHASALRYHT